MASPSGFLDELRNRIGLADVVGRRVRLVKKGREHHGLCPFHKEKTPSFTVNEEKGFYHCFGCGAHGSAFDFVMETEGLNFREAVGKLAGESGMAIPEETPEARARDERRKTLYDVTEAAARFFETNLKSPAGTDALSYLRDRGLADDTLGAFRLGFAPEGRDNLKKALLGEGLSEQQLIDTGLIIKRDDGSSYDRFRGRVMFPISDRRGRVVAFGGRIMGDGEPKYLNSPETDLFHKGGMLYALDKAQVGARAGSPLVVVEGYMDVIVLHQAGFTGAVAPLGTALTEDQIRVLWKVVPEPVLCFDGDNAGRRAMARAAERVLPLLTPGVGLRFATVTEGEDPDSLVRTRGPAAFKGLLESARPLSEVLWHLESTAGAINTPEGLAALQKRLEDHARRIDDPTVRSHFLSNFKERIWAGRGEARGPRQPYSSGGAYGQQGRGGAYGRYGTGGKFAQKRAVFAPGQSRQMLARAPIETRTVREEILLATLICHPELFDQLCERFGTLAFSGSELDNLRQEALKTLAGEPGIDTEGVQRHLRHSGFGEILDKLLSSKGFQNAFFARPEAKSGTALEGWEETYALYRQSDLQAEILEAQQRLAAEMSPEATERLRVLTVQELDAVPKNAK